MFEDNWVYRIIVILALCILLTWTYLTNEETLLNYIGGKFVLDTRLIWQIGIFSLLSIVLFYLMQSTLDFKTQNEILTLGCASGIVANPQNPLDGRVGLCGQIIEP